ncbi:uracil-DNA glycosylase [Halomonas pacifica]|uniref:uracil-DNA glycosylase n=1 Tax=Bisbaumannia pacifica TaxID=77098 RepID=UPI002359DB9C|nr:uracil-DNA glycosylase [Halomonas pacifica]MDC8802775.1 uracil-DNA glycosylase [Halomonas pacifica]
MSVFKIVKSLEDMDFKNTFNPYYERCQHHDAEDAPELRRYFLTEILMKAADSDLDAIWVGRDLGYRGGRRTGLALTDDIHLHDHLKRWGLETMRPSFGKPVAERTASVIWDILSRIDAPVFLWNVFPLHPFLEGDPFSNRAHNARERRAGSKILKMIVEYLKPNRIIAIGNDAYNATSREFPKHSVIKVRHPSYGGQADFVSRMQFIYGCAESSDLLL